MSIMKNQLKTNGAGPEPHYDGLEQTLTEKEMLCEGLLGLSPYPISIVTIEEGRFLHVNDQFCRLSGYSRQQLIGRTAEAIGLHLETEDRIKLLKQLQKDGQVHNFIGRIKDKDAVAYHNQMSVRKIRYQGHDCLLVITTDYRSQSETGKALQESETRFKRILNSIQESYFEVDLKGNFTFFNNSISTLLKWSTDELTGMNYKTYTLDDREARRVYEAFHEVYESGCAAKFVEYAIKQKDGGVLYVEASASLLKDRNGTPIGFYGLLRDRTSQKKAEEIIRQSEESYRSLLELAPDAISVGRFGDGRYLQVNNSFCKLSGYHTEEIIGRTALDLNLYVNPMDRFHLLDQLQNEGQIEGQEIQFRSKTGEIIDTLTSARRIRFRGLDCILVIVTNVTALKKTQEALNRSEEKFKNILETMEEGYYEVDEYGNFTYFNQATLNLHGYASDELMGMNYKKYIPAESIPEVRRQFIEMYQTGVPAKVMEYGIICKDGSIRNIEMSAYPRKDSRNNVIGFCGITRDRTIQKKAEYALKKREEHYRLLVNNANDGIYITQNGRIQFHNPKMVTITGYTDEELSGMMFADIVHPEDKDDAHQRKLEKIQTPEVFSFRIHNKKNEIVWVDLSVIGITWNGGPAALNFLRDVTVQKKMEAQLLQAKKMEAVGSLAGGIAHDFNNLLMGIKGNTTLALMDMEEDHPLYPNFFSIEQYVRAGSDLTKQLLGAAKSGKYEVKPTDLNRLVLDSVELFGRTQKEICIHKTFSEDLWSVEVDHSQIEQVLLNILINAWHAMPQGGDLYVETHNIHLDELNAKPYAIPPGPYVKLTITDTGIGIDPENIKRIFDPFFTTKGIGKGTGLGLASAYGIISNHGGVITVYSEIGTGATFNIYLPASDKKVTARANMNQDVMRGSETILFVDDEPGIVEVALLILQRLGYTVISAPDGNTAIDIYQEKKEEIDIVIVDMIMPGFSGGDTFDALKKINPDLKVILSSGYSLNGQAQNILDKGCNGFIQKPFSMQNLSAKLREVLDGD